MLTFTAPMLLWGVLVAAVPVLVHLLLRARPQRLRFPALPLMRATLASGQRANRVRNLVLLAVRAGVFAGLALLLAGPTCAPRAARAPQAGPVAGVFVLDDSISTRYRLRFDHPTTLLDTLRAAAERRIREARGWPAGSRIAVLSAAPGAAEPSWTDVGADAMDDLAALVGAPHANPLGGALGRAAALLAQAGSAQPRLVVFTDLAASTWRDVPGESLAAVDGLQVEIVGPAAGATRRNVGLVAARGPDRIVPASSPVPLAVAVRSTGTPASCWLTVRREADVVARVGPLELAENVTREITVELPPQPAGPHAAVVALEPSDLWPFDQEAFVAFETGSRPEAWLVGPDAGVLADDLTAVIVRNLLAPAALEKARQRFVVRARTAAELGAAAESKEERARPVLLVVLSSTPMEPPVVDRLRAAVRAGTVVLLVPRADDDRPDWPAWRALFSPRVPAREALEARTVMRAAGPAGPAFEELARTAVWQRVRLEPLVAEAKVVARYGDGVAAIVRRPLGAGQVVLLTTTPDPRWSELGVRAAGLLTWLHELGRAGAGNTTRAAQFTTLDAPPVRFAGLPDDGPVAVVRDGAARAERSWVRLRGSEPLEAAWPHAAPGVYSVHATSTGEAVARYAVNWPEAEGDFAPIAAEALAERLGVGAAALRVVDVAGRVTSAPPAPWYAAARPRDALAALVLGLFTAEVLLAARRGGAAAARNEKKPRDIV